MEGAPYDLVRRCLINSRDEVLVTWFAGEICRFRGKPAVHRALDWHFGGPVLSSSLVPAGHHQYGGLLGTLQDDLLATHLLRGRPALEAERSPVGRPRKGLGDAAGRRGKVSTATPHQGLAGGLVRVQGRLRDGRKAPACLTASIASSGSRHSPAFSVRLGLLMGRKPWLALYLEWRSVWPRSGEIDEVWL